MPRPLRAIDLGIRIGRFTLDALLAAETMTGAGGATAIALPLDIVRAAVD
jgi:hypothetical protein